MTTARLAVLADTTERADFPNLGNRYLLRSERTGGRVSMIEHTIKPRALAAPLHTHSREDEYSLVLDGRMGALIGDIVVEAGPGELVMKPRGIPHAFWSAADEETKLLEIISPGGFETYFADLAPVLAVPGTPDLEQMAEIRARYGLSVDVTSIASLSERFGLRPAG
jgi:mannose-6-phosphate isomerase-like protein (cupin superfamily)